MKENVTLKNWCFWTMVFEIFDSPLYSKEIQPVNAKGNQSWIFIERTHAEAETPVLSPPDAKSQFIGKDPGAGKDWGQEEKGRQCMRWLDHWLNGREFGLTSGASEGQGSLAWCSSWDRHKSDTT